ncbi:MAG: SAM-dependent chlorinase/fluorinase [Chlamydiota bacterium]|nr:SAM-dependent chlorinase/fluorinase [Chlamydiota bacterium]
MAAIVTLTTDFGTKDWYVGAMKGAILSICPEATLVDITHDCDPFDIKMAAFQFGCAYSQFPIGTVHLVVVDPGVGSDRESLIVETKGFYFVAPNNGILSYALKGKHKAKIFKINYNKVGTHTVSPTFHGRDIFAPAAAYLLKGVNILQFCKVLPQQSLIKLPLGKKIGKWCRVMGMDRFGNILLDIHREHLLDVDLRHLRVKVPGLGLLKINSHYSQMDQSQYGLIFGGSDYLEIALRVGNAAKMTKLKKGDRLEIVVLP